MKEEGVIRKEVKKWSVRASLAIDRVELLAILS
jgi:hypothetical protein